MAADRRKPPTLYIDERRCQVILTIADPIYQQDVVVAIDESNPEVIIKAVKRCGYTIQDEEELAQILDLGHAAAKTVMDPDSGAVVMRFRRMRKGYSDDMSDLAHESVHAATMLFDRVGFPLEASTDEPMAYYVAFLVRSVVEGVCRKGAASAGRTKRTARTCGTARSAGTTSATHAGRCSSNEGWPR